MYESGQNRFCSVVSEVSLFEIGFENINENNQLLNLSSFLNFLIVNLTISIRLKYMVNSYL